MPNAFRSFRRTTTRLLTCLFVAVAVGTPSAQVAVATGRETTAASVASYPLSTDMPVDPEVLIGGLQNGLRFYIRPNPRPAHQIELRLVVKAGSVLEDDDQRGLAHFVEHMQFQGSRHFPGQSIDSFLASIGLSIGSDANAVTSFDDTQYSLRVPTDRPDTLDKAMTVLEDWAGGALFEQAAIERQRGIVLSEWRLNLGADERTADKMRHVQLEGSRYADRSPIGDPAVIQAATREQLVRFYHDWYRPNLMAVIVVGEVDKNAVAAMIRQHFSSIDNPVPERPRPVYDVPEHAGTRYAVLTDKENTNTVVSLSDLRPARNQGTVGGYRDIMKDQLFSQMLGDRLDEIAQGERPPFLRAAAGRGLFPAPKTRDEASLQALVPNDGVTRGIDALVTELKRVTSFGFTATELDRAKQANMAASERAAEESPDRESSSRADEYTRNFLQREALPTIWQELAFHRRFMPEVTLNDMNALAADWFPATNRLVVALTPEVAGRVPPTDSQLAAAVNAASARPVTAYVDAGAGRALMDHPPAKGTIVKTTMKGTVTEWTLSNGATVALLPTTLKADQILFRATAPGGMSLASDADFYSARVADDVIPAGGVGDFSEVVLDKLLNGKSLAVQPFINEIREGMRGGSAPRDLETMFQLMYLRFTAPRADQTVFAAMKARALAMLADQSASPDVVFNQTLASALSSNHMRRQPETSATVAKWNLDTSLAFYKARFADASNFTFVFVGSFTLDTIRPLVETYIASLPATRAHETWRDQGVRLPNDVVQTTVRKGIAPKSEVAIVFNGPFEFAPENRLALQTATLVLQGRLNDAIREQLGATYAITAESEASRYPRPEYRVKIDWTCDPAQVDSLVPRVFEEVASVRDTALNDDQMTRIRSYLLRELDRNSQENGFLLNQILRRYESGEPLERDVVTEQTAEIKALTSDAVARAAVKYLDPARYVRVTLMPEASR
ncbi:MAG TPA: insulinase family protein [Vicinamibacterales bacterium]|jgi:zinc protease